MAELFGFSPSWAAEFPNDNPMLHEGATWVCLGVLGPARPVTRPRAVAPVLIEAAIESPAIESPTIEALAVEAAATLEVMAPEDLILDAELADAEPDEAIPPLELDGVFEFDADGAAPAEAPDPVAMTAPAAPEPTRATSASGTVPDQQPNPTVDPFAAYVAAIVDVAQSTGNTPAAAALPMLLGGADFDAAALPEEARERLVGASVLVRSGNEVAPSDAFAATADAWRSVLRGTTNDLAACGESTLDGWSADLLKAFGVGQGGAMDVRRELRRRGIAAFGMLLAA